MVLKSLPNSDSESVKRALIDFEHMKRQDPFAPLHENFFDTWGEQLLMQMMAPNFEIAMLLSKMTGSAFITDSQFRWNRNS